MIKYLKLDRALKKKKKKKKFKKKKKLFFYVFRDNELAFAIVWRKDHRKDAAKRKNALKKKETF